MLAEGRRDAFIKWITYNLSYSHFTGRHMAHRYEVLESLSTYYTEQDSFKEFAEQDARQYDCAVPSMMIIDKSLAIT